MANCIIYYKIAHILFIILRSLQFAKEYISRKYHCLLVYRQHSVYMWICTNLRRYGVYNVQVRECMLSHFSRVWLCTTLWTVAHQLHGILRTRILDWVVMPFSSKSSQLRDRTHVSCRLPCRRILYHWATREALTSHRQSTCWPWLSVKEDL